MHWPRFEVGEGQSLVAVDPVKADPERSRGLDDVGLVVGRGIPQTPGDRLDGVRPEVACGECGDRRRIEAAGEPDRDASVPFERAQDGGVEPRRELLDGDLPGGIIDPGRAAWLRKCPPRDPLRTHDENVSRAQGTDGREEGRLARRLREGEELGEASGVESILRRGEKVSFRSREDLRSISPQGE